MNTIFFNRYYIIYMHLLLWMQDGVGYLDVDRLTNRAVLEGTTRTSDGDIVLGSLDKLRGEEELLMLTTCANTTQDDEGEESMNLHCLIGVGHSMSVILPLRQLR